MALPTATPAPIRSPQVVGSAFVHQYYHLLHTSPEIVHRFYQETSTLARPNSSGEMTQVSTLRAISDSILSFKFNSYIAEIETFDAASSYMDGVSVIVTGSLTASDNVKRKFVQSFFLAPQEKGYFVLTDIFRFLDQNVPKDSDHVPTDGHTIETSKVFASEPVLVQEKQIEVQHIDSEISNKEDVNPLEIGGPEVETEVATVTMPVSKAEAVTTTISIHEAAPETVTTTLPDPGTASLVVTKTVTLHKADSTPKVSLPDKQIENNDKKKKNTPTSVVQENGSKKSYASIVKVVGIPTEKITAPSDNLKAKTVVFSSSVNSTFDSKASGSKESNDNSLDVEGYSVHIRNLPFDTTAEEVEEVFGKFGPIRPGCVQVRHKFDNFCFGFVEFESPSSMQAAIEASPVIFGHHKVYVDEKRTTTRVVNGVVINGDNRRGRGQGQPTRGNYHNDNFRRNGNFQGQNGYFTSRGRGRGGPQGYYRDVNYQQQRPFQNGGGRKVLAVN